MIDCVIYLYVIALRDAFTQTFYKKLQNMLHVMVTGLAKG